MASALLFLVFAAVAAQPVADTVTTEELVVACSLTCTDEPPASPYDVPRCDDYNFHSALIDALANGDRSALEMLKARYLTTDTLSERQRIAGALLRRVSNEGEIWEDLIAPARVVVRFPRKDGAPGEAELQWCAAHHVDPEDHRWMAIRALEVAGADPRSHELLLEALATSDDDFAYMAVSGLARQHDLDSLPRIEDALKQREDWSRTTLALALWEFADERADALAAKYLDESELETYWDFRNEAAGPDATLPH